MLLSELWGDPATREAIAEVMATGHVGAEYVEYVLRRKKGLSPGPAPLKLGNEELDGIRLSEPDLSLYDYQNGNEHREARDSDRDDRVSARDLVVEFARAVMPAVTRSTV